MVNHSHVGKGYTRNRARALMKTISILALVIALIAPCKASADAGDFYQGKTITIVVGYSPGGGYDINARLVARHFGRFIPGNPSVVVSNMPGAGSLRSVEYIQRRAPRDGTVAEMFD